MKKIFLFIIILATLASCTQTETVEAPPVDKAAIVLENMMSRRSIRAYKPEQISKAEMDAILLCAINAPSAKNSQPWEVRIIQNPEMLAKIKALGGQFYDAPSLVVVAKDKNNLYGDFDSGLLSQNLMLAAEAKNIGTCALGSLARVLVEPKAKGILDALSIPEGYEVMIVISLGYKNEDPGAPKPREAAKVKYID